MTVIRSDRAPIKGVQRLSNGFLKVPVTATRTGIFIYRKSDGTEFRELRLPSEVFDQDSMNSLGGVPVTNQHPNGLLDSNNASKHMVGFTSDLVERRSNTLATSITVTDGLTIEELDVKKSKREVSCGYSCEMEFKSGTYQGERYDAIQRNIRYNHLAIVDKGRAGPVARIHMDGKDVDLELTDFREFKPMAKIKIDGVEYEINDTLAPIVKAKIDLVDASQAKLDAANAEKEKLQAKVDSLSQDLEKEKENKLDSDAIASLVKARKRLEKLADLTVKSDSFKVEEASDRDIMVAIIKSQDEKFDDSDRSDAYLEARVDHIEHTHTTTKETPKSDRVRSVIKKKTKIDSENEDGDNETVFNMDKHMEAQKARWEKPLTHSLNRK